MNNNKQKNKKSKTIIYIKTIFLMLFLLGKQVESIAQINIGVAGTPSVVNAYYPVSALAGNVITVGTRTGIAHTLAINDRVLLVQMTGSTSANGGKFEYRKVTAVSGTSITLDGITRAYTPTTEKVQLVWCPYNTTGITVIANVLAQAWNGSTGGIIAFLTDGTITLNGAVLADGAGYRGTDGATSVYGPGVYGGGGGSVGTMGGGGGGGGYGVAAGTTGAAGKGGAGISLGGLAGLGAGGTGKTNGTAGTNGGGGGGASGSPFDTPLTKGGKGAQGIIGGAVGTTADCCGFGGEGGAGGVAGGGGGGGGGAHSGGGGGGASPTNAGCGGGAGQSPNAGGTGAINGVGYTAGVTAIDPTFGPVGTGGGGGAYIGGGGGGGGQHNTVFTTGTGGGGGGRVPASGYHTYFSCTAGGTCADPRIWMGGGISTSSGGGIVMMSSKTIVSNSKTVTANGLNGVVAALRAYGAGGGGMVVISTNSVTGGTLAICSKGGAGAIGGSDVNHAWGSSGGGGGGVIWVQDPAGAVGNNINATATPPAVANMSFCVNGGIGGAAASNPKSASFGGGGGCAGAGVVQVNDNSELFPALLCTAPTLTSVAKDTATCTSGVANSDAKVAVRGIVGMAKYAYGTNGTTGLFAVNATASTKDSIKLTGLANPVSATTYTFRIYASDTTCYNDTTVVLPPSVCPPLICAITATFAQNGCNNNGTTSIATDDYFTVDVAAVSATNGGASGKYEVVLMPAGTVLNVGGTTYGTSVSVGGAGVFSSDGTATYLLKVRDLDKPSCVTTVFTTATSASCSTPGCPSQRCIPVTVMREN